MAVTKASEVLSGALEFWGTRGERWTHGILDDGAKACLYGGLGRAAYGYGVYEAQRLAHQLQQDRAFNRAKALILDELESRPGFPRDLVGFNDNYTHKAVGANKRKRFDMVKDVVCHALKRALLEEAVGERIGKTAA